MDLHLSQTNLLEGERKTWFELPMDLHLSQTLCGIRKRGFWFELPMDLHLSQTKNHGLQKRL